MTDILKQLTEMEAELKKPFPTEDINKICEDFRAEFLKLPEEIDFYGDFQYYCVNIAGTLSYVLADDISHIPQGQIDMLDKSFFEYYHQYEFLEDKIANYHHFFQEYKTFEQARIWLLQLLRNWENVVNETWQVQKQVQVCQMVGVYTHELHINEKLELSSTEFVLHFRNPVTLESWYWKLAWFEDDNLSDHLIIHEQHTPEPLEYTIEPIISKDVLVIGSRFNFNDNIIHKVTGYGYKDKHLEILSSLVFKFDQSYLLVNTGPVIAIKYMKDKPNVQNDVIFTWD